MDITLKATLRKRNPDKDGLCPIAIAIRGGGRELYCATGVKVLPDHWVNGSITKGVKNYDILNSSISKRILDAERKVLLLQSENKPVTLELVKGLLKPEQQKTEGFLDFYRAYIDNIKITSKKAPGTIAIWETEYNSLKEFTKGVLPFSAVTHDMLDAYHVYLAQYAVRVRDGKDVGYKPTTLHKKLKKLLQIIRSAVRKGKMSATQVDGFEMVKYVEPETHYLTLRQTQELSNRLYAGEFDGNLTMRLVVAFFLVECYGGIRFGDWHRFEVETLIQKSKFKVRTAKTGAAVYLDLSIFTSLAKILDYIKTNDMHFNLTEKTANQTLKTIGKLLDLKFPLSTHDGRRTFGTLLGELGYRESFIAEAMGISAVTARRYIKITGQNMSAEQARVGGF
jgi:integrase